MNLRKKTENRKIYPPHPSNTVKPFQKKKTTQHFSVLFLCVLIRTPFEEKKRRPKTRPAESGDYKVKKDFFQIKRENFIMAAALLLASCVSSLLKHIFLSKSTNAPYNVYTCKVHFSICLACLFLVDSRPTKAGGGSFAQHGVHRVPTSSSYVFDGKRRRRRKRGGSGIRNAHM